MGTFAHQPREADHDCLVQLCGGWGEGVLLCLQHCANSFPTHPHTHPHRPWQADTVHLPARNGPASSKQASQAGEPAHTCLLTRKRLLEDTSPHPNSFCVTRLWLPKGGRNFQRSVRPLELRGFFPKRSGKIKLQSFEPGLLRVEKVLEDTAPIVFPMSIFRLVYLITRPLI